MRYPVEIILQFSRGRVFEKNLAMLHRLLKKQPGLRYRATIYYHEPLELAKWAEEYPLVRWRRFIPYRGFERSVLFSTRGDLLVYFDSNVMINPKDIAIAAATLQKATVLAASLKIEKHLPLYSDFQSTARPYALLWQWLKNSILYVLFILKRERYRTYALLNSSWGCASHDVLSIHRGRLLEILREMLLGVRKELQGKSLLFDTGLYRIDYSLSLLLQESGLNFVTPGQASSIKYLNASNHLFSGILSSYRQLGSILSLTFRYRKTAQPLDSFRFTTVAFQLLVISSLLVCLKSPGASLVLALLSVLLVLKQVFSKLRITRPVESLASVISRFFALLIA